MGGMPINMKELGITPTDEQITDAENISEKVA
jgi:hypothetical protein